MSLKKKMSIEIQAFSRPRRGGMKVFLGLFLLFAALIAGLYLNGSLVQEKQRVLLEDGYAQLNRGDYEKAYSLFRDAGENFTLTLKAYRALKRGDFFTQNDLGELIISTCIAAAHDKFFQLEPADEWVKRAEKQLPVIADQNLQKELTQLINTAKSVSQLCSDFAAGEFEKALKSLKQVENEALPGDQDFFIFEIRFLIACGKALEEPIIINQARRLLFFATTEAGINNERTRQLWGILSG